MDIDNSPMIGQRVIQLRIVVLSLVIGLVMFAAIAGYMVHAELIQTIGTTIISYLAAALLFIMFFLQLVFFNAMESSARHRLDPQSIRPWLDLYHTRTIIGCAMFEGPAFLGLCGYILERQPLGLFVAGFAGLLMLALNFPTETRLREYIQRQQSLAEEMTSK